MSDLVLTQRPEWQALERHAKKIKSCQMRDLFAAQPSRFSCFSASAAGLLVDYSKNLITSETMQSLLALSEACDLAGSRRAMFSGERINTSEDRSVLHVALRDGARGTYLADGHDVMGDIQAELYKMKTFCQRVHTGELTGYTGKALTQVVNIGIGGSDLGPAMVTGALGAYHLAGRTSHFVSNVDRTHLAQTLAMVDPERTLFIIASKTFTTQETMTNAASARDWFLEQGGCEQDVARHFVALSTNEAAVQAFGIDPANMFRFWDWVGGRYSLWSVVGLAIALQIGFERFAQMLAGAHEMDVHFATAPEAQNLPLLLALVGIWNRNFLDIRTHAVLPYDQYLSRFPAYLQQADMESNGKSVTKEGAITSWATGPVIFGEPGTNGQHAFYQLIHQGSDVISTDFIAAARSHHERGDHQQKLLANFLAQPQALMMGKALNEVRQELHDAGLAADAIDALAPHKVFPGNRPSTSILMDRLTPSRLGALIALYEHKIFCQGVIWGINSFDQWGVELGKVLAKKILPALGAVGVEMPLAEDHDTSTKGLLDWLNQRRKEGSE